MIILCKINSSLKIVFKLNIRIKYIIITQVVMYMIFCHVDNNNYKNIVRTVTF